MGCVVVLQLKLLLKLELLLERRSASMRLVLWLPGAVPPCMLLPLPRVCSSLRLLQLLLAIHPLRQEH